MIRSDAVLQVGRCCKSSMIACIVKVMWVHSLTITARTDNTSASRVVMVVHAKWKWKG